MKTISKVSAKKVILFAKSQGNHSSQNANLSIDEVFNTRDEAENYLNEKFTNEFANTSTNDTFEEFVNERSDYFKIAEYGEDNFIDKKFYNEEE